MNADIRCDNAAASPRRRKPASPAPWTDRRLFMLADELEAEVKLDEAREAEAEAGRADFVKPLIAQRCPELTDEDLAQVFGPVEVVVPAEIVGLIEATLGALADRIDRLQARLDAERSA
jgi:hypothetical protein